MSMVTTKAFAYDIAVENRHVTIYYNYINNGRDLEVTYYSEKNPSYSGSVMIPSEVIYENITRKVISIGREAFYGCSDLSSVFIPNSVTSIGISSFSGCSGLTSVTIPQSVTYISRFAFQSCSSLTSVTIPKNVEFIDNSAFMFCSSLTSIIVERGNTAYDSRDNCNAIIETQSNTLIQGCMTSTIPNSVTSIRDGAFSGCEGMTSITIPNSVTSIGMNAFFYCNSLTSVTIPNNVPSIDAFTFQYCSSLTSVTIGKNVSSIGSQAFDNCNALTTVISLNDNPSSIEDNSFSNNTYNNAILYVPKGKIDKYQAAKGWKEFLHIEEINGSIMCATPAISYKDGKLSFYCETEGAECHTTITNEDIKSFDGNEIDLAVTYNISVYATKDDYVDSEMATATLCWIEANPQNEAITTDVNQIASVAVLIKTDGGQLSIEGATDNTTITAYTLDGVQLGSAVSRNGVATINTNVSPGTVMIVKIGNKSVKVVMR